MSQPSQPEREISPFLEFQPRPVPQEALDRLQQAALGVSGGSQAVRSFLYWLAGEPDPSGYVGSGGLELRRLDAKNRQAALDVINWWALPEDSEPLHAVLETIQRHVDLNAKPAAVPRLPISPPSSFLPPPPAFQKERLDGST